MVLIDVLFQIERSNLGAFKNDVLVLKCSLSTLKSLQPCTLQVKLLMLCVISVYEFFPSRLFEMEWQSGG